MIWSQGTQVGVISSPGSSPPYLIVPQSGDITSDLSVNSQTGEIRTKKALDRENSPTYVLSAIPVSGGGLPIQVEIKVSRVSSEG